MVNLMDMVNIHGQIKLFLKDISWTVFEMVRDYGVGKIHAENSINIVDIMKMIKKMDSAIIFGLMEINTKGISLMILSMDRVNYYLMMVQFKKEHG